MGFKSKKQLRIKQKKRKKRLKKKGKWSKKPAVAHTI